MDIAKNISTELKEDEIKSKVEIVADDIAEAVVFTIPGVESIPINGQKVLAFRTEAGDLVVFGVPLKSSLKPGERRFVATDENGAEKITITIYADGKIEIKNLASEDLVKLIHDLSANLQTAITDLVGATVPTSLGPQSLSVAIPWAVPLTGLLAKAVENTTNINFYKKWGKMPGISDSRAATALVDALIAKDYVKAEFRNQVIEIQTEFMKAIFDELKNYGIVTTEVKDGEGNVIGSGVGELS